jgi:hypothetical protein
MNLSEKAGVTVIKLNIHFISHEPMTFPIGYLGKQTNLLKDE